MFAAPLMISLVSNVLALMYGIECKKCAAREPIMNAKSVLEQINGILTKVFAAPGLTMNVKVVQSLIYGTTPKKYVAILVTLGARRAMESEFGIKIKISAVALLM